MYVHVLTTKKPTSSLWYVAGSVRPQTEANVVSTNHVGSCNAAQVGYSDRVHDSCSVHTAHCLFGTWQEANY